ncbi:glutamate--tRNA ligase [Enemella evansiae]|uniref:glutamate--tRNA ligase n=1 Tax=Enemella evansiae TaxID=2016499 RepID=UPI001E4BD12C|nr:glutamate--tRNA ligase [Enemella evansiae]
MSVDNPGADFDVLGGIEPSQVRVRFPPSPTGNLHVGNVRSALFNWAFARHYGGTFVLRIEDTDAARSTEESLRGVLDSLRWLGIDWDEGPEVGGPYAPYLQSERRDKYAEVVQRLIEGGYAYRDHYTREEIEALGEQAIHRDPANPCPTLSTEEIEIRDRAGEYVIRMHVPDHDISFDDLVRGRVTFTAENVPDYVIVRTGGDPLYTLVNPVDDALMGITHVLRGEDLLSSTPRQLVMYAALAELGVGSGRTPIFGHLPIVMGEGNRRLSKRDKGSGLAEYQELGYLPEGLLNYLALLGWAIAEDRDVFTKAEMAEAFDIRRVSGNPARFDPRKCLAINAAHIRMLDDDTLAAAIVPFLVRAGLVTDPPQPEQWELVRGATPLIKERLNTLSEAVDKLRFLFTADDAIEIEEKATLKPEEASVLDAAITAVEGLPEFTDVQVERALRGSLVEGLGLKPKLAFGPVRTAITGSKVSPPLFESMALLGRESSLTRLRRARATVA